MKANPMKEIAAGEERERLLFRLLLINKWFLIPTAIAYELILSASPSRSALYNFILPTIFYTAISLIFIVLLWIAHHRLSDGRLASRYTGIASVLNILSFFVDAFFVFYQIFLPEVGNILWLMFLPPMSLALLVPHLKKNNKFLIDGVASAAMLVVIYGLLYTFESPTSGPRFIPADMTLCLSGLFFMWVNLRHVHTWMENLNREISHLANWNGLWNNTLQRFPTEFFLVNDQGEVVIASDMARKLLPLPLPGQPDWPEPSQSIRNALVLRFHAETTLDDMIQIPDDDFPHPITIYPTFFAVNGQRYCIALAQEQNPSMPQSSGVLRSDRLAIAGQIAAGLAHELGNPLGVIQSCAAYLSQKSKEDDPNREEYDLIQLETQRCQNLIDRLLSLASPKRDTLGVHDLRDILNHSISLVKYQAGKHPIDLSLPPEPVLLFANEGQISAVFVNLFLNALQSMDTVGPDGTLRVHARVRGEEAIVDITDEGTGITKEELEVIFDPFYTKRAEGTGLGLSIVHQIITSLGGRIDVASTVGSGTTFTVTLPVHKEEDQDENQLDSHS